MAVTKFRGAGEAGEAWDAGVRLFGESRVQEAVAKLGGFRGTRPGAEIHLIGSLQRNKAKAAAAFFDGVQSVDRESLADELARVCAGRESPLPVLLEWRTGEESKNGFADEPALLRATETILASPFLEIRGLMTMAPFVDDEPALRGAFRALARLRDGMARRYPAAGRWDCLSMGMSGDFELAVEEGSTLVRIGGAIFGADEAAGKGNER